MRSLECWSVFLSGDSFLSVGILISGEGAKEMTTR